MKVLCFGSLNIDMVYTLPHIVNVGETLAATKVEVFPGGKGLNQAIALGRAFSGGDKAVKKASNMSSKLLGEQVAEESPQIYMAGGIGSDGIFLKKHSAGVRKLSFSLGLALIFFLILAIFPSVTVLMSVPFGIYWRTSLLAFSMAPFCHAQ